MNACLLRRMHVKTGLLFTSAATKNKAFMSAMASSKAEFIAAYVTVPSKDAGKKLAGALLQNKLAACVNMIPGVESYYWWEGKVQSDPELLLMIKTREEKLAELTAKVQEIHEYDTPEVIALPIVGGSSKYLDWVKSSTE